MRGTARCMEAQGQFFCIFIKFVVANSVICNAGISYLKKNSFLFTVLIVYFLSFSVQNKMGHNSKTKHPMTHVHIDIFRCFCS